MSKFSKIFTVLIILLTILFINDKFGTNIGNFVSSVTNINMPDLKVNKKFKPDTKIEIIDPPDMIPTKPAADIVTPDKKAEVEKVSIYYLSLDKNNNTVYKRTEKQVPDGEDPFNYAIKTLLKGPDIIEKSTGAYSEIPAATKLYSIRNKKDKIIIDLSSDFQFGGGTDSIYSRLMQLIKTATENSGGKKVYLYIDGKQINAFGGEGLMITQPLSEKSLEI